jgi:hypothetical protein
MLFDFTLEYATRKVHENQVGLKLNGTHQLLVYADVVYLLENNTNIKHKSKDAVTDANKVE